MGKELTVVNGDNDLVMLDEGEEGGSGIQNTTSSDNLIPRLQIAAGTSKQLSKASDKFIKGLAQGDLFNTVTGKIYGDSVTVVPVWYSKNRVLFQDDNSIECSSPNGVDGGHLAKTCEECEFSKWGSGKAGSGDEEATGFACTEFRNFAVLILDESGVPDLVSVSLKSTSAGAAKQWINMIDARKALSANGDIVKQPMYYGKYLLKVSSKESKKKPGAFFFVWTVNNDGNLPNKTDGDKRLRAFAKKTYESFKAAELHMTGTQEAGE